MNKPVRLYWDACAWIAYISQEVLTLENGHTENRFADCRHILKLAEKGRAEIATSAFTLAEVCKSPNIRSSPSINLAGFFDRSYILMIPLDTFAGRKAQSLQISGISGLKPADAVHVASAFIAKVDHMHTYDRKLLGLNLKIDGRDGSPMSIVKPGTSELPAPLLEAD